MAAPTQTNPTRARGLLQPSQPLIRLSSKPSLAEARDDDDDWTGMTDAASRRKRQGRLNTRAYRRRKALQVAGGNSTSHTTSRSSTPVDGKPIPCWDEERQAVIHLPASRAWALSQAGKPLFGEKAATPTRLIFPLSSDHLITLVQVNVLRACHINGQLLAGIGFRISPYEDCTNGALRTLPIGNPDQVPPTLAPTRIQTAVPHEAWVDVFPHPVWRDNLIKALGTFDEDELCSDMVGGLFDGGTNMQCERRGMVIWSPPWHYEGWELSEGFVQKWGWTIKGCDGILEATNKWRSARGENPLPMMLEDGWKEKSLH